MRDLVKIELDEGYIYIENSGQIQEEDSFLQNKLKDDESLEEKYDDEDLNEIPASNKIEKKESTLINRSKKFFDNSINQIVNYSKSIVKQLKESRVDLDEVEMEFSTKFDADFGFIITNLSSEVGMRITVKWKKEKKEE